MAAFSDSTYSTASYAAHRPSYPDSLYQTILEYHKGPRRLCVDLGCGHGVVTRALAPYFDRVIGIDPSNGMITQARDLTPASSYANVEFHVSTAESLPFIEDESVDLVVAGGAAHWFDYPRLFPELKRVVRPEGTLAFWSYRGHVFVDHPKATSIYRRYIDEPGHGLLGDYWQQPGRSIVQNLLRDIHLPENDWEDERRTEYQPGTQGPGSGQGEVLMTAQIKLGHCREYLKTHGAYHAWRKEHPGAKSADEGGSGDIVDEVFQKMLEVEPEWLQAEPSWKEKVVTIEWGTAVIFARRKAATNKDDAHN